jgi:hypothetical protein
MRRNNLWSVLIIVMRSVLLPLRTHLIHRPAKDTLPPAGGPLWGDRCPGPIFLSRVVEHLRRSVKGGAIRL